METGGETGLINRGELEHIVSRIEYEIDPSKQDEDIFWKSALIFRGIVSGHPFTDGNKRTGWEVTDIFLRNNGWKLKVGPYEAEDFIISVAMKPTELDIVQGWIQENTVKLEE